MAGAHADPDELRSFADVLQRSRSELDEVLGDVRAAVLTAADSWRDAEYDKFIEVFRTTEVTLGRLADAIERFAPLLRADAEKLDAYRGISID
jgi:hypothetical protein